MDYPQQNAGSQMPMPEANKEGGIGAVIGIIVIILVLIAGGWYIYSMSGGKLMPKDAAEKTTTGNTQVAPAQTDESLKAQLGTDVDISGDLNSIDSSFGE